jgi:hypothetical protein
MMTNDINQYKNVLELLKQALLFYANENNYKYNEGSSPIDLDEYGFQARFALEQLKKLEELEKNLENDYENITNTINENNNQEELLKTIENLKNINN